ncbi:MAG: TolC family protein [Bryobacteraceae bacterium]
MQKPILFVFLASLMGVGPEGAALAQQAGAAPQQAGATPQQSPGAMPQPAPIGANLIAPRAGHPLSFANTRHIQELIRAGTLYLSLQDALALAIENNLDVELERYMLEGARTEVMRTKGGGTARGLDYGIFEAPPGVGGPFSPLAVSPASGSATSGTSVPTNALEAGVLGEPLDNFSIAGTVPFSSGTAVPGYDPALNGLLNFSHQSTPEVDYQSNLTNNLVDNSVNANAALTQGFGSGATASLSFDNSHNSVSAQNIGYNPYNLSSLGLTVTQPLMRGFGLNLNRRYIRIAANEQRIASYLFENQLNYTVYGVIRLYTDFVALFEDVKVKEETVKAAEKLLADTQAQVDEGTLAPVELTRANAEVFSTRQDLINSRGLFDEQEAILRRVLTRDEDEQLRGTHIMPTDTLDIPAQDDVRPIQDLIADAMTERPDINHSRLQVEDSLIGLEGSRNATRPEIDLVGTLQNSGLAGPLTGYQVSQMFQGGYGSALGQVLAHDYPTYAVGLQVTLPLRNRVAEADRARDEVLAKQTQVRYKQLQNLVALQIEDALIAMRRARASYEAATQARKFQQESLEAEQARFQVGASTAFFVIQYESLLAQARSTEVAAKSSWLKARAALEFATGRLLRDNGVSLDAAKKGTMK